MHKLLKVSSLAQLRELGSTGLPVDAKWSERSSIWKQFLNLISVDLSQSGLESNTVTLEKRRNRYRRLALAKFSPRVFEEFDSEDDNLADLLLFTSKSPDNIGTASLSQGSPSSIPEDFEPDGAQHFLDSGQLRQIHLDLIRTRPQDFSELFADKKVQYVLTRMLYIWGVTNPASGYVQGINDIAVPFFIVYLLGEIESRTGIKLDSKEQVCALALAEWNNDDILNAECDTYLSLEAVLAEMQDNYISGRPGIVNYIAILRAVLQRINPELSNHFREIGVNEEHFALRWINCLFAREFATYTLIRIWDGLLADGVRTLKSSVLYISVAILTRFQADLKTMDFEKSMLFLQKPPTLEWDESKVPALMAEAYVWRCLFEDSPNHLLMT